MFQSIAGEPYLDQFQHLVIALALGLLIGIERGWAERTAEEGKRVAGIRTFGLISLLGALWQVLAKELGPLILGLSFTAFTLLIISLSFLAAKRKKEYGITSSVAALIAFAIGALAMSEHITLAAAATVITVILLGMKPVLHGWLRKLEPYELTAAFKLLLISLVLLPILPNRGFGPWQAFNPYETWWMVVLISAISFSGYFAIKIAGPNRGIILTGLFGGLASSTAVTLSLSRLGRKSQHLDKPLAAGIAVASVTMFPRISLVAGVINPMVLKSLAWPMGFVCIGGYTAVWWLIRHNRNQLSPKAIQLQNPFEFKIALQFGLLLAMVMLLTRFLHRWLGDAGLFLTAAVSGISDVDAITISLSRLTLEETASSLAAKAIILAAIVNTTVKAIMVVIIAGWHVARYVVRLFSVILLTLLFGAWVEHFLISLNPFGY